MDRSWRGIAVPNSILLVNFANERAREQGIGVTRSGARSGPHPAAAGAHEGAGMIIGMIPMALGPARGGSRTLLSGARHRGLLVATLVTSSWFPRLFIVAAQSSDQHLLDEKFDREMKEPMTNRWYRMSINSNLPPPWLAPGDPRRAARSSPTRITSLPSCRSSTPAFRFFLSSNRHRARRPRPRFAPRSRLGPVVQTATAMRAPLEDGDLNGEVHAYRETTSSQGGAI